MGSNINSILFSLNQALLCSTWLIVTDSNFIIVKTDSSPFPCSNIYFFWFGEINIPQNLINDLQRIICMEDVRVLQQLCIVCNSLKGPFSLLGFSDEVTGGTTPTGQTKYKMRLGNPSF